MNAHPHDHDGQAGLVYVLHFDPAYRHARHYIGWARNVDARLAAHLAGSGSRSCARPSRPASRFASPPRSRAHASSSGA